jgi:hypothetical protein
MEAVLFDVDEDEFIRIINSGLVEYDIFINAFVLTEKGHRRIDKFFGKKLEGT